MPNPIIDIPTKYETEALAAFAAAYATGYRPWTLIDTWEPLVDAQAHDFTVSIASYSQLELRGYSIGTNGVGDVYDLRVDGALAVSASPNQVYLTNSGAGGEIAASRVIGFTNYRAWCRVRLRAVDDRWIKEAEAVGMPRRSSIEATS